MKRFCSTGLCALTAVLPLHALEWNSGITDGRRDGTWDNGGAPNWNDNVGAPSSSNETWSFLFGTFTTAGFNAPEDGTVTVNGTVRTSGIEAGNGGAYAINGGTINRLFSNLPINVGDGGGGVLEIGATLSTGTAIKQGPGTLILTGTTTGNLRIEGGLVTLSGDNIPDGSNLDVRSGAGVSMIGDDSVDDLDLAGTLSGSGVLNANTYTLRDGAVVDGYLGEGDFIKADAGTVTINGAAASDVITIPEGTLVLSGHNLDDLAQVTTSGNATLEVNDNDTVGTYVQNDNASLTGTGTLTTANGATLRGGEIAGRLEGSTSTQGEVLISGTVRGNTLTVQDGTLTVTGTIQSRDIAIAADSTLIQRGNFGSRQDITNAGILTVDSNTSTYNYVQQPGAEFNGSGMLETYTSSTLNGGEVAGTLLGNITSTGDVLVSGTIAENGGRDGLAVTSGTLTLTGDADFRRVNIAEGATILNQGDLDKRTRLDNSGTLANQTNETIAWYIQQPGGLLSGSGMLTTTTGATLNGGQVAGTLLGHTTVNGPVTISGTIGEGKLTVNDGTLTLTGTSTNDPVRITPGATLLDRGDLSDTATLTNDGTLTVEVAEIIGSYVQNAGGLLNGTGTLTTKSGATLNGGEIAGALQSKIISTGDVLVSGNIGGGDLTVAAGTLDLTGTSNNPAINVEGGELTLSGNNIADNSEIEVQSGATLTVNGHDTTLTSTIHGTLNGSGTLTSDHYRLRDGAVVNGHLGEGQLHMYAGRTGSITVNGTLSMDDVYSREGTLILSGNNIADTSTLGASFGQIQLNGPDTVDRLHLYFADLAGNAPLTATNGATLNANSSVSGNLQGDITVDAVRNGTVNVSGTIGGGSLTIELGPLHLTGTSTNTPVMILDRGILLDSGDLSDTADITNSGTLQVDTNDKVGTYTANGGLLSGTGRLTAINGATLNNGSEVSGILAGTTTTAGDVLISGTLIGRLVLDPPRTASQAPAPRNGRGISPISPGLDALDVTAGTLTVTGHAYRNPITIHQGATILDQSQDAFHDGALLTNHGHLVLDGHEAVNSYHSSATGALQLKVTGSTALDHLTADTVTLDPGSTLILAQTELLVGQVADIIDGAVDGTFAMIEALAGAGKDLRYSFNPNHGTIQALPGAPVPAPTPSNALYNLSTDQTQVIGTVFDATHLGEEPNFRRHYYRDTGNTDPDQRWREIPRSQARMGDTYIYDLDPGLGRAPVAPGTQAALLDAAITAFQSSYAPGDDPGGATIVTAPGLAVANALSPEVHQGMADFTRQAMRSQMRTAMRTPAGAKAGQGHVFATFHSMSAGSSASTDGASYNIDINGGIAGVRYPVSPQLRLGAMLGTVHGDIDGSRIDTDGHGFMIGVFGEYLLDPASQTNAFASLGLGSYSYDATRQSFGGPVYANNIDSHAIEIALGLETVAWQSEHFRLIPRGAFRYLNGRVDGFTETGPGVQMRVSSLNVESLLFELGLDAEFDLNERTTLNAHLGLLSDLLGSDNGVTGTYLGGGLPVRVNAPGVDGEAAILGFGASFDVNATTSIDLNWRSEFRDGSQDTHLLSLGGRVTF